MKPQPLAKSLVPARTWPFLIDAAVMLCALAFFFAVIRLGAYWLAKPVPGIQISHSIRALPLYAFYSMARMGIAYLISLVFAVSYGYIAFYNHRAEVWMIAVLDILQSIPVLSFLPGVMLAMIALFPGHQMGIELGSIILLFTSQAWNLAFSFYSSLKSIPREMVEATRIYRFSAWQRLWQLELPFAAIGLIWNSIVSVASGWFVLIPCEMLTFGDHDFRLPGLGSFLSSAATSTPVDKHALFWGSAVLVLIIVATDQLIWRPLIAWSDKFKFEQVESSARVTSPILTLLSSPSLLLRLPSRAFNRVEEQIYQHLAATPQCRRIQPIDEEPAKGGRFWTILIGVFAGLVLIWTAGEAFRLLRDVTAADLRMLFLGAGATLARVVATLLIAALWTIPVGVAIGSSPKLAGILQPITQIVAAIPASAFFPVLMVLMLQQGVGLGYGAVALMLLGTQWYVLFNVIAGAMAIPSDLKEAAAVYKFTRWQRWTRLILPGIFPYLITGMVTASGGAWNTSILAEYGAWGGRTLQTVGLGSEISAALGSNGKLSSLIMATVLLAAIVVTMNRFLWRRLYRLAETRYKLEG